MTEPTGTVLAYARGNPHVVSFVSGTGRAKTVIGLLLLTMVIAAVAFWAEYQQYQLIDSIKHGTKITMAEARANDQRVRVVVLSYLTVLVIDVVFFMMWIHRVYRNLNSFPGPRSEYTPGWAVGYYFIPFLNLARGYQVMREIFEKSRPQRLATRSISIVAVWWALWLLTGFIARLASIATDPNAEKLDKLLSATRQSMINHAVVWLPAIVAIIMVWQIDRMQQERSTEPEPMPPALPT